MNAQTAHKLNMYKAIESVFTLHASKWNFFPGLRGAFSRFALKVAQIDLLANDLRHEANDDKLVHLIHETDQLLLTCMDQRIHLLQQEQQEFYTDYLSARAIG